MHATGDFVFDTIEKANVQVLEKIEAWEIVPLFAVIVLLWDC